MTERVVAFVPDLMDRSRILAVRSVEFVTSPVDLPAASAGAALVIVDLGRPGVLEVLAQLSTPVVGFGSHVDRALLDAARAAGCDQVLTRSAFFSRLDQVLRLG
jgi:DNA-binding NarL/FixJ family response regulator